MSSPPVQLPHVQGQRETGGVFKLEDFISKITEEVKTKKH